MIDHDEPLLLQSGMLDSCLRKCRFISTTYYREAKDQALDKTRAGCQATGSTGSASVCYSSLV
jgi:hypothetical protein